MQKDRKIRNEMFKSSIKISARLFTLSILWILLC